MYMNWFIIHVCGAVFTSASIRLVTYTINILESQFAQSTASVAPVQSGHNWLVTVARTRVGCRQARNVTQVTREFLIQANDDSKTSDQAERWPERGILLNHSQD